MLEFPIDRSYNENTRVYWGTLQTRMGTNHKDRSNFDMSQRARVPMLFNHNVTAPIANNRPMSFNKFQRRQRFNEAHAQNLITQGRLNASGASHRCTDLHVELYACHASLHKV